jgi:hypothetical protein
MASQPPFGHRDEGAPPERPVGEPIRDLHPTMDARFVLVEIGKLMSQTEANTKALEIIGGKLDALERSVSNASLIGKVLVGVFVLLAGGIWWLGSVLWPLRDKLIAIFDGH